MSGSSTPLDAPPSPSVGAGAAAPRRPRRRWRRALVAVAVAGAVIALVGAGLTWRWFVRPPEGGPIRADAVVMFGGAGPRFHKAVQLVEEGYADVIVLSDPHDPIEEYTAFGWFCRNEAKPGYEPHPYEAICFEPETHTTRGESRFVAELARQRGWRSIDLVTTTEQGMRAKLMLSRCWDGEINLVTVPTDLFKPSRYLYEWGALARATLQRRSC